MCHSSFFMLGFMCCGKEMGGWVCVGIFEPLSLLVSVLVFVPLGLSFLPWL